MKVVVIGAGVIGVSIADALASRGAQVTVLDARSPARGATQASAGMLAPYAEAHGDERLLALGTRGLALFDEYIARLTEATGKPIHYARTGTLEVAFDPGEAARLQAAKRALDAAGAPSDMLDGRAVREREPCVAPGVVAGLLTRAHGFVDVRSLAGALVDRARFAGAVFEAPVEAAQVESRRDEVEVRAGDRRYAAEAVVVAAGSWSRRVRVANVAVLPVRPVRGQLLHLQWTDGALPQRIVWGADCYTVPWSDGTLLVGATVEDSGFDESATVAGVRDLTSSVTSLLPGAATARLEGVRVGLRPALPDLLPAIGPVARAPRVVMATGHYRSGILLAPLTAEIVTRHLLDRVEDEAFQVTSPDRFLQ